MKVYVTVIFMVMLMAAYPVCELTRCIVEYNIIPLQAANAGGTPILWLAGWAPTLEGLYLELALIWGAYICIPVVLWVAFKLARKEVTR